jgi:DNA-binding protein H-NS
MANTPKRLASMSLDALMQLRDDIGSILSRKAVELKKQLSALGPDYAEVGRIAVYGSRKKRGALAGRKVAPKYRDPKTKMTWAGRGAMPVWMRDALKAGKKADDFLIDKSAVPARKAKEGAKKGRPGRPKKA